MIYWLDEPRRQSALVARRTFWVMLALSLLVHLIALLVVVQRTRILSPGEGPELDRDRLQVRLAEMPPAPPSAPERLARIVPIPKAPTRPPTATLRAPRPPPVIATPSEAPPLPTPPQPAPPVREPSQATHPIEGDLWSYIQARRRERGESTASSSADQGSNLDANLAANLPRPAIGVANSETNRGGGIFEIKRMTYDDAAFVFFGWNKDMGRRTPQLITVRIGNNADMRIAVVRRMIAIIRDYTQEDFTWRSLHHEGGLLLSARPQDNEALETFLLHEFFDQNGEPQ
jgi:hypothetical protein